MITVNILTNPATYSPANAEIWFQFNSASYSVSNFKYVTEVFELDGQSNAVQSLGSYKFPPRPYTGDGLQTVNSIVKSILSYTLRPTWGQNYQTIGSIGYSQSIATESNMIKQYSLNYGFEYDPGLTFSDTFISGTSVGFTFSTPHGLITGDLININKDNKNINSYYDGLSYIISVGSSYSFTIDKAIGNTSSVETGSITSVQRVVSQTEDFWAYNGTRQYDQIGINFGDTYVFQPGFSGNTFSFLENYNGWKQIFNSQWETTQFFANNEGLFTLSPSDWQLYIAGVTSSVSNWVAEGVYASGSNVFFDGGVYVNITGEYAPDNDPSVDIENWQFDINASIWVSTNTYLSNEYVVYNGKIYENISGSNGASPIANTFTVRDYVITTFDSSGTRLNTYTFSSGVTQSQWKSFIAPTGTKNLEYMGVTFSGVDKYRIAVFGGTASTLKSTLYRQIVCNPSPYTNVRVAYMNRLGAFEYLNFNYDSKRTASISRTEYKQILPWNYTIGMRGTSILSQKVEESYQLSTNWLTQYDYQYYSELLTSPEVYIIDDMGRYYPVIVVDSSYEYKTTLRDKLFNLVINVRNAYQINLQNQ